MATAIYVEHEEFGEMLGAMMYSPTSQRIEWLAGRPDGRRQGIGTALMEYMLETFPDNSCIEVKTFVETAPSGKAAQSFYRHCGFQPKGILEDVNHRNAGHPFHLFVKE